MRKTLLVLLAVAVLLVAATTALIAGGGQNTLCYRGIRGLGTVAQHQINANCDWAE